MPAARLNISLTHRESARRLQYVTGHGADGALPDNIDWRSLADPTVTTIVYMPKKTLSELAAKAITAGLDPATPSLAIAQATRPDEIVISDSVGRAWRLGTVGLAIGVAGLPALHDRRGEPDLSGRLLEATEVGFADAGASAGVLVMGEAAEGSPAALVRGLAWTAPAKPASALVRAKSEDLFR